MFPAVDWIRASSRAIESPIEPKAVLYDPDILLAELVKTEPIAWTLELIRLAIESTLFAISANALFGDLIAFEILKSNAFLILELMLAPIVETSFFIVLKTDLISPETRVNAFLMGSGNFAPMFEEIRCSSPRAILNPPVNPWPILDPIFWLLFASRFINSPTSRII